MSSIWKPFVLSLVLSFAGAAYAVPEGPVNINTATAETLASALKGVGLAKAEAIVRYRDEHGPFIDIYELSNVKGIGDRTVEINEALLTLEE